jgi:hypothetical protein
VVAAAGRAVTVAHSFGSVEPRRAGSRQHGGELADHLLGRAHARGEPPNLASAYGKVLTARRQTGAQQRRHQSMFIRLFVDRKNPKSLMVINVASIRYIVHEGDGASQKCGLCFAHGDFVTVDHEFDSVVLLLEKATGSRIHPIPLPPARPAPQEVISELIYSKSQGDGRI